MYLSIYLSLSIYQCVSRCRFACTFDITLLFCRYKLLWLATACNEENAFEVNSSTTIRTWFCRPQRCARATRREADSSRDGGDYEAGAPSGAPVPPSLPTFLHLLLLQPLSNCSAVQPLLIPLSNYLLPIAPETLCGDHAPCRARTRSRHLIL